MSELLSALVGLFLMVLMVGFCLGVMAERVNTRPRPSRKDVDIDAILMEAERPYYETVP